MIDHQYNMIVIECDACDATFEGNEGDEWKSVWPAAKREGWRSTKIADEWVHTCPKCKP
jgi:rubredoxin